MENKPEHEYDIELLIILFIEWLALMWEIVGPAFTFTFQ